MKESSCQVKNGSEWQVMNSCLEGRAPARLKDFARREDTLRRMHYG